MCGIAGIVGSRAESAILAEAARRLAHRGPDDSGVWLAGDGACGLAHTRLAVIDLSPGGHQPMASACGRWAIVFNGEIYNYRDLRRELAAAGHEFRSDSDTEVLLALLARDGAAALHRLVGMFAFALWDGERRELLLGRDRLGVKPLVFAPLAGGGLAFASEIAALAAMPGIDMGLDGEALSDYLACLYVPAPRTIHLGMRKLPPGHLLRWRNGQASIEGWWRPAIVGGRRPSLDEAVEEVLPLLRQAVRDRMVADVPLGCFLSGGIDSSVIAALMAEEARAQGGGPVQSFTMTFDNPLYDEREGARQVAAHVGARHTELAAGSGLAGLLDDMVLRFGEPFGNPTALLIHDLSRKAREHVTVALVGDGGDEVFAGYPRYQGGLLAGRLRALPHWLRAGVLAPSARLIPESSAGRHAWRRAREFLTAAGLPAEQAYASWVEYFSPAERAALLGRDPAGVARPIAELYARSPSPHPLDAMQQTDLVSFLPGNLLAYGDAMSMRHALELRLPLLDHRLIEAVGRLAPELRFAQGMKTILKAAARRLLPAAVVERPKRGFNPPMGAWLKGDLAPLVAERLAPARLAELGIEAKPVAALLAEQRRGLRDHALKIWALLALEAWARADYARAGTAP